MNTTLYPGIPFSPQAQLTNNIGAADTIIEVSDVSAFPPAPNLATIGTDEEGETILYTAKTETALSGCQRGVEGQARGWTAGELIGRNFTAKDHADLIAAATEASCAAEAAQEAAATAGTVAATKQPKLTGAPGQVVGFGADGAAVAVQGWSNPNLLDNWYFADPINQRGETEYTTEYSYTIDRWINGTGKLELTEQGLIIPPQNHPQQVLEDYIANTIKGRLVTISLLCADNTLHKTSAIFPQNNDPFYASDGYINFELAISDLGKSYIALRNSSDENKIFVAAKLELGPVQTLAHQDADGNWVLNDPPPNKALELAECQRYQVVLNASLNDTLHSIFIGTGTLDVLGGDGKISGQGVINLPVPLRGKPAIPQGIAFYAVNANAPIEITGMWIDQNLLRVNYTVDGSTPMDNKIGILYCTNTIIDANL